MGSVSIISDQPLFGVIVFGGSFGLAGVNAIDTLFERFVAPVEVIATSSINTGIALQNPDDEPVEVALDLYNQDGTLRSSTTLEIPAGGQTARMLNELVWPQNPVPAEFEGTLQLREVTGMNTSLPAAVSAAMIQVRIVDGTSQYATLPVNTVE